MTHFLIGKWPAAQSAVSAGDGIQLNGCGPIQDAVSLLKLPYNKPMENLALIAIVENLRPAMSEVIIRRVVQHQRNGFIFQTRSVKMPAFKLVADPQNPALYPSESRPPIDTPSMDFLMVLRKHLASAELLAFNKPLSERIVEFVFKTAVPTKELETMSLVFEMLPNAPNIILLDAARRVVSSFLPITPQHTLDEYETYAYPSSGTKSNLEEVIESNGAELNGLSAELLVSKIGGLGPVFAREIVYRQKKTAHPVVDLLRSMLDQARAPSRAAWIYTELPLGHILEHNDLRHFQRAILSPVELESLSRTHSSKLFANILEAAKFYFDELASRTQLEQAKLPVLRDMRQVAKRLADREKRLLREKKQCEEAEGLQKTAQMLTSSRMKMDQHYESVTVTDYFGDEPKPVDIQLDPTVSLKENIERMFKRYQKAARGKSMVTDQLGQVRNRMTSLEQQTRRIQAIKDWDTWLAIASKIRGQEREAQLGRIHQGFALPGSRSANQGFALPGSRSANQGFALPGSRLAARPLPEGEGRRFRALKIEGQEILIGKGARENDELTFDVAAPDDFWLHVAEYSGSHVIVRNPQKQKELDEALLVKAAQLAAYFSQARNSSKVEVHYTKRKHVTKPRRAKPGLVRLLEFKTIKVEPKNWLNS
jgi:predicted ribosome quality control (RQC) complex YloA/Tae2 family protein